jgi:hypothetical protein
MVIMVSATTKTVSTVVMERCNTEVAPTSILGFSGDSEGLANSRVGPVAPNHQTGPDGRLFAGVGVLEHSGDMRVVPFSNL